MKKLYFLVIAALLCIFTSCDKIKSLGDGSGDFHQSFTINSITPLEGEPGTIISIKGNGFSKDSLKNEVKVNGTLAHVIKSSDTTLQVIIPETNAASASIVVSVNHIANQQGYKFNYYDVYVSGRVYNSTRSFARLWKNGVAQSYPDTSFQNASRLSHDGSDVYFGTTNGYYKNNSFVKLNTSGLIYDRDVYSVVVNKGNVYAAISGGYYKNGILKPFGQYYPQFTDIVFNQDTMYLSANDPQNGSGLLYKNDVVQALENGDRHASAQVVSIHGKDVHVGGQNDLNFFSAAEWVNGKFKSINGFSTVYDIFFNGNDEYEAVSGPKQVLYLKNGIAVSMTEPNAYLSGTSIEVLDNNTYVAGAWTNAPITGMFDINPLNTNRPSYTVEAVYFRNGIKTVLPRSSFMGAVANSILVLKR